MIYSARKAVLILLATWAVLTAVQGYAIAKTGVPCEVAGLDAAISNLILAIIGVVTVLIFKFYQPGKTNHLYRAVYVIAIVIVYYHVLTFVLHTVFADNKEYLLFVERSLPVRTVMALLVISFITIMHWLVTYMQDKEQGEKNKKEMETMMREAELVKLRQQLQPHFLFNSLNSINALVIAQPQEARKMVQQLSEFLRGTLRKDEQKMIPLKDELTHLNLYLEIEKVRFGHRLKVETKNCDTCLEAGIPPLLLQPVVENAIKFGLYDTTGGVIISIETKLHDRMLTVEITNPFDPATQRSKTGNNFGLESINRRLYLLFARKDLLRTRTENSNFITTIAIPQL
jgi:two-component system, LytTR family, sensor kinase